MANINDILRAHPELDDVLNGKHVESRIKLIEDSKQKTAEQIRELNDLTKSIRNNSAQNLRVLLDDINGIIGRMPGRFQPDASYNDRTGELIIRYYPDGDKNYKGEVPYLRISADENGAIVHNGISVANAWVPIDDEVEGLQMLTNLEYALRSVKKSLSTTGTQNRIKKSGTNLEEIGSIINSVIQNANQKSYQASSSVSSAAVRKDYAANKELSHGNTFNNSFAATKIAMDKYFSDLSENKQNIKTIAGKIGTGRANEKRNIEKTANAIKKAFALFVHSNNLDNFFESGNRDEDIVKFINSKQFKDRYLKDWQKLKNLGIKQGLISDSTAMDVYNILSPQRFLGALGLDYNARKVRATNETRSKVAKDVKQRKYAVSHGNIMGASAQERNLGLGKSDDARFDRYLIGEITQEQINEVYQKLYEKHITKGEKYKGKKLTINEFQKIFGKNFEGIIEDAVLYDINAERELDSEEFVSKKILKEELEKKIQRSLENKQKKQEEKLGRALNGEELRALTDKVRDTIVKKELNIKDNQSIIGSSTFTDAGSGKEYMSFDVRSKYAMHTGTKLGFGTTRAVGQSLTHDFAEEISKELFGRDDIHFFKEAKSAIEPKHIYEETIGYMQYLHDTQYQGKKQQYVDDLNEKFSKAIGIKNKKGNPFFFLDGDGNLAFNQEFETQLKKNYVKFMNELGTLDVNGNPFELVGNELKKNRKLVYSHEVNQLNVAKYGHAKGEEQKGGVHFSAKEYEAEQRIHGEMRGAGLKTDMLEKATNESIENTELSKEEYAKYKADYQKAVNTIWSKDILKNEKSRKKAVSEMNEAVVIDATTFTEEQLNKLEYDSDGNITKESYDKSYLKELDRLKKEKYDELKAAYGEEALKKIGINSADDIPIYIQTKDYSIVNTKGETITGNTLRLGNYHGEYNEEKDSYRADSSVLDLRYLLQKSNEDLGERALGNEVYDYLEAQNKQIFGKEGGIYKKANRALVKGAYMPTTVSSNPEKFKEGLVNTLVGANKDVRTMLGKKRGESDSAYLQRIKAIYTDLFTEWGDANKVLSEIEGGKGSDRKKAEKLLETILQGITYSDDKNSLYQKNHGRGIITKVHRYPSINGKDVYYVKTIIDPEMKEGAIGGDPYLLKAMNADYDGDHIVVTSIMGDGTIFQTWTVSEQEELLRQSRDAQVHDTARIKRLAKLEQAPGDPNKPAKPFASQADIDEAFDTELKTTFLTKFNKTFTGQFDNTRRAMENALRLGGVDETSIQAGNIASQENAIHSQIIRSIFEVMSQEAISAKKATLSGAYNADGSENPEWWNRVQNLRKKAKEAKTWKDPASVQAILTEMQELGILGESDLNLLKNRITSSIGSESYDPQAMMNVFGNDIFDSEGNLDYNKLSISKDIVAQAFTHIFGGKNGKGGTFNRFATTGDGGTRSIGGLSDIFANQSYLLDGVRLPPLINTAAYEEHQRVLAETTTAVNQEREAEEAKIAVATKEGQAISKLSNSYKNLQDRLTSLKETLKDTNGDYATSVSKILDKIFPTGYPSTDDKAFTQNAANYILNNPGKTLEELQKVGYKGLGYQDKKQFETFRKGQEVLTAGTVSDSTEQALKYLRQKGHNVSTFEDILKVFGVDNFATLQSSLGINFADLRDTSATGQKHLLDKIQQSTGFNADQKTLLSELFKNDESGHDVGLFSILGQQYPLLSLLYGRQGNSKIREFTRAGEAMFQQHMNLTGGDISRMGPEEQWLMTNAFNGKLVKGRSDIIDYGTEKDFTGQERDVINVIDKKYAKKMSPRYIAQVYAYIKALEQAQQDIVDKNYDYDEWLEKSELGKWYSANGGFDETLFDKLKNGALIKGGINLINKRTGMAEYHHIGYSHGATTDQGKNISAFRLSENADIDTVLKHYLENGIPESEWDPAVKSYMTSATRQSQDPSLNFRVNGIKPEEDEKVLKLEDIVKLYKEIRDLQKEINKLNQEGTEEATNLVTILEKERDDKKKDLTRGVKDLSTEDKAQWRKQQKKMDAIAAYEDSHISPDKEGLRNEKELRSLWKQVARAQVAMNRNRSEHAMTMNAGQRAALDEQYLYQGQELKSLLESVQKLEKEMPAEKVAKLREEAEKIFGTLDANRKVQQHGQNNFWGQLGSQFARLTTNFLKFSAASRILQTVRRDIQKVVQAAKELDKAMTNIRIVTQKSAADAKQLINQYADLASQIGVTTTEVATSANEWFNKNVEITHK